MFSAFAEEIGINPILAYRLFEGFGGGFGGKQEVCGAFSAAVAVISYYASTGSMDGKSKLNTYKIIQRAVEMFEHEYGSIRCKEILHGNSPKAFQCGMKVKDAVLMASQIVEELKQNEEKVV